jgi:hypothetical protein
MHDVDALARRIVVNHGYLLHFRRRSPAPGAATIALAEARRIQTLIDLMHRSSLLHRAELVTVESVFESFDDQPPDVQAVFRRLMEDCERLVADPKLMAAVAAHRQKHYPGVLELACPTTGNACERA